MDGFSAEGEVVLRPNRPPSPVVGEEEGAAPTGQSGAFAFEEAALSRTVGGSVKVAEGLDAATGFVCLEIPSAASSAAGPTESPEVIVKSWSWWWWWWWWEWWEWWW